jgi:hypothetical protein
MTLRAGEAPEPTRRVTFHREREAPAEPAKGNGFDKLGPGSTAKAAEDQTPRKVEREHGAAGGEACRGGRAARRLG